MTYTWYDSGGGVVATTATFDPPTATAGTFTYTLEVGCAGTPSCPTQDDVVITIIELLLLFGLVEIPLGQRLLGALATAGDEICSGRVRVALSVICREDCGLYANVNTDSPPS